MQRVKRRRAPRRSLLVTYVPVCDRPTWDQTRALRNVRMPTDEVFGA